MIKFVDENLQSIWVRPEAITAVVFPSPLSPGNAKHIVFTGPIGFPVTSSEARRVLPLITNDTASEKEPSCLV